MNGRPFNEYRLVTDAGEFDFADALKTIRLDSARYDARSLHILETPKHPKIESMEQWLDLNA